VKATRIIKREFGGDVRFIIQQKHWLIRWSWCDASLNDINYASCVDYFSTLDEAKENIYLFDGTKCKETVIK